MIPRVSDLRSIWTMQVEHDRHSVATETEHATERNDASTEIKSAAERSKESTEKINALLI